jgi:hypothetical protein
MLCEEEGSCEEFLFSMLVIAQMNREVNLR